MKRGIGKIIFLAFLAAFGAVWNIFLQNYDSTKGEMLVQIRQESAMLDKENVILANKLADLSSISYLAKLAPLYGFGEEGVILAIKNSVSLADKGAGSL